MERQIMKITDGTGAGDTPLSAFDAALFNAGIANYNLVHLSSIIPPGYEPRIEKLNWNGADDAGSRLYVVIASQTEIEHGKEAWAGLGWVLTEDQSLGLFVEHTGHSEQEVRDQIDYSLKSMILYRKQKFGEIKRHITGIICQGKPVCALVAAPYKVEPW